MWGNGKFHSLFSVLGTQNDIALLEDGLAVSHKVKPSLVAQLVKNLPAMQESWVWSLGWEDPLEKEKATHSSILAWRIPWTV